MARQPANTTSNNSAEDTTLEVLSNAPIEGMPEEPNTMTAAAADAHRAPMELGDAKALKVAQPVKNPTVSRYRVLEDKAIMGANGFRAKMRAGKVVDSTQYNIEKLRSQGVRLEKLEDGDLSDF